MDWASPRALVAAGAVASLDEIDLWLGAAALDPVLERELVCQLDGELAVSEDRVRTLFELALVAVPPTASCENLPIDCAAPLAARWLAAPPIAAAPPALPAVTEVELAALPAEAIPTLRAMVPCLEHLCARTSGANVIDFLVLAPPGLQSLRLAGASVAFDPDAYSADDLDSVAPVPTPTTTPRGARSAAFRMLDMLDSSAVDAVPSFEDLPGDVAAHPAQLADLSKARIARLALRRLELNDLAPQSAQHLVFLVASCPMLTVLRISLRSDAACAGTWVVDRIAQSLVHLSDLALELSPQTVVDLAVLLPRLHRLHRLLLARLDRLTCSAPLEPAIWLTSLSLAATTLEDSAVEAVVALCSRVRHLRLEGAWAARILASADLGDLCELHVRGAAFEAAGQSFGGSLTRLEFVSCTGFASEAVRAALRTNPLLDSLAVVDNSGESGSCLLRTPHNKLRRLVVSHTACDDAILFKIPSVFPRLRIAGLVGCPVTSQGVDALRERGVRVWV